MNAYDDSITIQVVSKPDGKEVMTVTYVYGKNPLDLVGDSEKPRKEVPIYDFETSTQYRMRMFDPYVEKLAQHYELGVFFNKTTRKFYGHTTLVYKFWTDLVIGCNLIARKKTSEVK